MLYYYFEGGYVYVDWYYYYVKRFHKRELLGMHNNQTCKYMTEIKII